MIHISEELKKIEKEINEKKPKKKPNVKRSEDTDKLFKDLKVFWAFSKKQFDENKTPLEEGDKYIDIGAGGFIPKSNVDALLEGMKKINKEFKEAMKDEKARVDHIRYELNNHEAFYTRDITSTMEALGDDFTKEEVLKVFNGRKK